jgi:hypothetical protein
LPKPAPRAILLAGSTSANSSVALTQSTSAETREPRLRSSAAVSWLPVALIGAGALLGLALWAKWGFAIAFDAIRTYCF